MNTSFFRLARLVSRQSSLRVKVGCVIVSHGKPVSMGHNVEKTHPLHTGGFCKTIHAEISALLSCDTPIKGATVYVYREKISNGKKIPALARPCNHCYSCLVKAGVRKICYSVEGGFKEEKI